MRMACLWHTNAENHKMKELRRQLYGVQIISLLRVWQWLHFHKMFCMLLLLEETHFQIGELN
jgi:hypothetical protein